MTNQVQIQLGDGATTPAVKITITEVAAGQFKFDIAQSGAIVGDLRGLFFDVSRDSALTGGSMIGLTAANQLGKAISLATAAVITGNDTVTKLGGGDNMNGALSYNGRNQEAGGYDVGVEFGTSGIGKDDVGAVSFTLNLGGMTLSDLAGQDFGLRMTSVGVLGGARDGSLKLTGSSFAVAPDADEALAVNEDTTATGDLLADRFANTDGGTVAQSMTWVSLDGGATRFAFGAVQPLGSSGATIVVNADGSYVIDAQGADALAFGQSSNFVLTYGVSQTYFDAAGRKAGALTEVSNAQIAINGVNDAPVVSGPLAGAAVEDGASVTLNALANASDVDNGAVLAVALPAQLPAGVTFDATTQTFTLNPSAGAYQSLAAGQTTTVTVTYGVSDGIATTPATASWTITGTNDAPTVSGAVTAAAVEDGASVTLNALANASDVDTGAVLTVVGVPTELPAGVAFDAQTGSFTLNPSVPAYQSLAAGQTVTVTVHYGVSDGALTTAATATWTITGANDAPTVSGVVTGAAVEDAAPVTLNALANAADVDAGAVLSVVAPSELPAGVTYDAASQSFTLNPAHAAFQALAAGQTTTVTVNYGVSDGMATTSATAQWVVTGVAEPVVPGLTGDNFPVAPKDLSHVTFYFEQSPDDGVLNLRTVKIDDIPGSADDDLDTWLAEAVAYVRAHDAGLAANAELLGAALKYATTELYYAIDRDNDVDAIPGGILIQNKYLDASFDYSAVFS